MIHHITSAQKQLIQIAIVAILLIGCVAVLMPFTGTLLLAVVICATTSSARTRLLALCGGRSSLTAALMCTLMILLLVVPMALLSGSLANGVETAVVYIKPLMEAGLPADAPRWLVDLPLVGSHIDDY